MKLSPLQITAIYITEIAIRANPKAKKEDLKRIDVNVRVSTSPHEKNPREWFVFLDIKISPEEGVVAPFTGELSAMGVFSVDENWPEAQMERLVYINGAGILYCASRELISTITAKSYFPALSVPSWSFFDMYKDLEAQRKAQAQPELEMAPKSNPTSSDQSPTAP